MPMLQAAAAFSGLVNATSNSTQADGEASAGADAAQGSSDAAAADQAASTNALALSAMLST
jgi:hypothetical protein